MLYLYGYLDFYIKTIIFTNKILLKDEDQENVNL